MTGVEIALAAAPYLISAASALPGLFADNPSEYFLGNRGRTQQLPVLNQNQIGLQNDLISQIQNALQGGQLPFEGNLQRDYQRYVVPDILERLGTGNGSGSALEQALAQSGNQLLADMSDQRMKYIQSLLPYAFNQSFENQIFPAEQGALPGILNNVANTAANQLNNYASDDRFNRLLEAMNKSNTTPGSNNLLNPNQKTALAGGVAALNNQNQRNNLLGGTPTSANNMRLRDILGLFRQNTVNNLGYQGLPANNAVNMLQTSGLRGY